MSKGIFRFSPKAILANEAVKEIIHFHDGLFWQRKLLANDTILNLEVKPIFIRVTVLRKKLRKKGKY